MKTGVCARSFLKALSWFLSAKRVFSGLGTFKPCCCKTVHRNSGSRHVVICMVFMIYIHKQIIQVIISVECHKQDFFMYESCIDKLMHYSVCSSNRPVVPSSLAYFRLFYTFLWFKICYLVKEIIMNKNVNLRLIRRKSPLSILKKWHGFVHALCVIDHLNTVVIRWYKRL